MATSRPLFLSELPEGCSTSYRNLFAPTHPPAAIAREQCDALWQDFHDLADEAFVNRLPFEFHQRWFEMYLGAALRRAGLDVSAPKPGPDFRVSIDRRPVFIEAIAPTPGNPLHADAVQEPIYKDADGKPRAVQVPHTQITLRLADAFRRKADVFDGYRLKGYVGGSDSCIIAINLRSIHHAWADADEFWFRALYGVGDRFAVIDRGGGATIAGRQHRMMLNRAGGAMEDVAPLLNMDRAGISGVLGSAADAGNVPNPLGDEFLLMPHAAAHCPYPPGFIRRGVELQLRAEEGERWGVETIDYGAHEPRGPVALVAEFGGVRLEGEWAVSGRTLSVRVAGHGCDVTIGGGHDPAATAQEIAVQLIRIYGDTDASRASAAT